MDPGRIPGTTDESDVVAAALEWIAGDPDPVTRKELQALVDAWDLGALADRMGSPLAFGTAGLRGAVGAGPSRMNRAVVIRTTRGLANYLVAADPTAAQRGVIVGFDARPDSRRFAEDVVGVLAAVGLPVRWFPTPAPTPLVAYVQKASDAAAAVVITASHNPPEDNGFKVYVEGAAQIVPPTDAAIAAAIAAVGPTADVDRADPASSDLVAPVDASLVDRYLQELVAARPALATEVPRDLAIVYTPLHGVGGALAERALADGGYLDVNVVPSQADPDGSFPTVHFPNPEEPGALDAALDLAREVGADLVLANDPDADRLAVAVPDGAGGFVPLSGNHIGVLLGAYLLEAADVARPLAVRSIVSSPMFDEVCTARGARVEATLTGFKWICRAALELEVTDQRTFVYGFEEALGSCVGTVVRDKDGIGAAVAFADLVADLRASGRTVLDRIRELSLQHGAWLSRQVNVARPGAAGQAEIAVAMEVLRQGHPERLGDQTVTAVTDFRDGADARPLWLPEHPLVEFAFEDGGRAMIRPSGTEPKCKVYVDLRADLAPDDDLRAVETTLLEQAERVAADLLRFVGLH